MLGGPWNWARILPEAYKCEAIEGFLINYQRKDSKFPPPVWACLTQMCLDINSPIWKSSSSSPNGWAIASATWHLKGETDGWKGEQQITRAFYSYSTLAKTTMWLGVSPEYATGAYLFFLHQMAEERYRTWDLLYLQPAYEEDELENEDDGEEHLSTVCVQLLASNQRETEIKVGCHNYNLNL